MAFWSTEKILEEQKKSSLISSFDEKRIKYGKYYLTLSREVAVTPDGTTGVPQSGDESFVKIPPGQFAILFTNESVSIPYNAMGFISVRTSEKLNGLVNISGFHVDPGFKGHLRFSVYNAGNDSICLDFDSDCFLLWFCALDRPTGDTYDKENIFQKCFITAKDHKKMLDKSYSPAALHRQIEKLEDSVNAILVVGGVIIIPLLIAFGVTTFERWFGQTADKITTGELIVVTSLLTSFFIIVTFVVFRRWVRK